jgi:hypothetical protein
LKETHAEKDSERIWNSSDALKEKSIEDLKQKNIIKSALFHT